MPDKIPFKCKRCGTTLERAANELDQPDVTVYRGDEPKKYTYRDKCECGAFAVTAVTVPGGSDA